MEFIWSFKVENIGPYEGVNELGPFAQDETAGLPIRSSKAVIYAGNGAGKTSLSRMFRILETQGKSAMDSDITLQHSEGSFSFTVQTLGDQKQVVDQKTLTVSRKHSSIASIPEDATKIQDETGYIFHVFNSDYVISNVEKHDYCLPTDIPGYIISAEAIGTAKTRQELESKKAELESKTSALEDYLEKKKRELRKIYSIGNSNAALNSFAVESFIEGDAEENAFQEYADRYKSFETIPEDASQDNIPPFHKSIDFEDLSSLISTSHPRSTLPDEQAQKIRDNLAFISSGVELLDPKQACCPFCEQPLREAAQQVISRYQEFINDKENEVVRQLDSYTDKLQELITSFENFQGGFGRAKMKFDQLRVPFSDLDSFPPIEQSKLFKAHVDSVLADIDKKRENVSVVLPVDSIETLRKAIEQIEDECGRAEALRKDLVQKLSKISNEKTGLRTALCTEYVKQLRSDKDADVQDIRDIRLVVEGLEAEILSGETQYKQDKKTIISKRFSELLEKFFHGKYKFDSNTSTLTLNNQSLANDTKSVLSDGEKTVIAFCYFLASTAELIQHEEDIEKLFFIIDDPISSLDFDFVYNLAQEIRKLDEFLATIAPTRSYQLSSDKLRFIVLTHNPSFFNILAQNKITKTNLVLSQNKLVKIKPESILPYDKHLRDIYEIAQGNLDPSHTTGNSIRHILDTLWHFESPGRLTLRDYFEEDCEDLHSNNYIYTLCNDMSHGGLNDTLRYDSNPFIQACKTLIEFIDKKYPNQIKAYINESSEEADC